MVTWHGRKTPSTRLPLCKFWSNPLNVLLATGVAGWTTVQRRQIRLTCRDISNRLVIPLPCSKQLSKQECAISVILVCLCSITNRPSLREQASAVPQPRVRAPGLVPKPVNLQRQLSNSVKCPFPRLVKQSLLCRGLCRVMKTLVLLRFTLMAARGTLP